jgi:peptidyl-dipeptidase A
LYWADTIIHELGHSIYDKYINKDVPFLLHEASSAITTEGFAMMTGSYVKKEEWFTKMLKLSPDEAASLAEAGAKHLRAEKLIFSRWAQVMVGFERGMYSNPDQDLGVLWWDLKAKYQLLNPPESKSRPDYAAKIHIVTHPVYYHSYMMGELFAAQVQQFVADNVAKVPDATKAVFFGRKEVGDYWKERIFGPGDLRSWNDLTKSATGKPLSPEAFAKQWLQSQ